MKPEQINIAIAEWMGWTHIEDKSENLMMAPGTFVYGYPPKNPIIGKKQALPDYLGDLNEMHKVEAKLTEEQQFEYHNCLWDVLPCDENYGSAVEGGDDVMYPSGFTMLHATAAQRAKAITMMIERIKL